MQIKFGDKVRILKDTCEGFYSDLVGKTVSVVDVYDNDSKNDTMLLVTGTGRQTKSEYLEDDEEIVWIGDVIKV